METRMAQVAVLGGAVREGHTLANGEGPVLVDPSASGEFNDFGGSRNPIDREALARGPLRNERNGQLIIERVADGKPIGTVGWHAVGYGPNPQSSGWNCCPRLAARATERTPRHSSRRTYSGTRT